MDKEKKPRKPDKRTRERPSFNGFPWEITVAEDYSKLPNVWINVVGSIENLAELKVVLYIMRHSWGFQEYDQFVKLTIDEFINGRKTREGYRMDIGTQLSDRAVVKGLTLAEQHGLIVVDIDTSDKARTKKFYKLRMQEVVSQDIEPDGRANNLRPNLVQSSPLSEQSSHRSDNELEQITLQQKDIRNTHPSENDLGNIRHLPIKRGKAEGPLFIKQMMEDFSRDCGDAEHTVSNVTRAYNLYSASGIDPDTFSEALYEARDQARKASVKKQNSQGRPNRMPYFFRCLEKSLKVSSKPADVEQA